MTRGILARYLLREAAGAWLAVTVVLLTIMLSTRFARFLAEAAAGDLPRELLFKVVALSSLQYLVILIPVSLLLAVMLTLGRLYKDNEVAAMMGCGVGLAELYRPFLLLAGMLALFTGALAFEIGPWAGRNADFMVKDARRLVQYAPFEPGRFKEVAGGRAVFYTQELDTAGQKLTTVFARVDEDKGASIVIASEGTQGVNAETGDREVALFGGWRYLGEPGKADFDIMRFEEFHTRVTPPEFIYLSGKRKLATTSALMHSDDREDQAELAWRIAAPISVFVLSLLEVPLSHIRPRQGRYGKIVLGIIAYLLYSNLMGVGQTWISKGVLPVAVGLWWVHAIFLGAALFLIGRRQGWFVRKGVS